MRLIIYLNEFKNVQIAHFCKVRSLRIAVVGAVYSIRHSGFEG